MHQRFLSKSVTNDCNNEYLDFPQDYLQMMYGQNDGDFGANSVEANVTQEKNPQPHTLEDEETTPPPLKRAKVMKQERQGQEKRGSVSDRSIADGDQLDDKEEGNK